MQVNIQLVDEQDLEEILRLQKDCYQSEAEIYNDYAIPPLLQDMQTLKKEFENSLFLKAVLATEIVGSIRAYANGTTCFVGKLIVKKDFRNNGIGGQLLRAVETYSPIVNDGFFLRDTKVKRTCICTVNTATRSLKEKLRTLT